MKKLIVIILIVVILFLFRKISFSYPNLTDKEALRIGEEKYMAFLWMVDGAFNDERYEYSYTINDKEISYNGSFSCEYLKNKETCIGKNFEDNFKNLFASNITYDQVYGDLLTFSWYQKKDDSYYFTNMRNCNVERMNKKHYINLFQREENKLIYHTSFTDEISFVSSDIHTKKYEREFVLVLEDNEWKISKAFYHDLCVMNYNIE